MRAFFKNKNDIGKLMMLIGIITLVPMLMLAFYWSEWKYFVAFLIPGLSSILLGFMVCCVFKNKSGDYGYSYTLKRGSLTVLFAWIYGILIGAVPFLFMGELNFLQCLFEAASGWTTTGFTVVNVSAMPHIFLFHRSFMQFCGGLGFILMMVMIIQNKHSTNLYNFEGHNDRLTPSVLKTARTVFLLYSVIFAAGVILYLACGMPLFDSVIHCMSALSTGGFSNKAGSIAEYNSIPIECVTILIMLLGMTNFAVLLLIAKRRFKQAFKVSEVKFTGLLFAVVIPLVAVSIFLGMSVGFGESVRRSFFNVVSAISTTGFSTVNFSALPAAAFIIIIIGMCVGGAAGSTAGGIKLNRAYLLFRGAGISMRKKLSPDNHVTARYYYGPQGKTELGNSLLRDAYSYTFMHILILLIAAILLCFTSGASFQNALFESASLLSTVGVSVGIFGPAANAGTLIVGIIGMIIARLEINIMIIGVCSIFIHTAPKKGRLLLKK